MSTESIAGLCIRMAYHSYETWSFSVHESHGSNEKQYVGCKLHFRLWSQEDRSNRRIKRKKNKKMWKISNLTFRKRCSVNSLPSKSIWRSNINSGSRDKNKHLEKNKTPKPAPSLQRCTWNVAQNIVLSTGMQGSGDGQHPQPRPAPPVSRSPPSTSACWTADRADPRSPLSVSR